MSRQACAETNSPRTVPVRPARSRALAHAPRSRPPFAPARAARSRDPDGLRIDGHVRVDGLAGVDRLSRADLHRHEVVFLDVRETGTIAAEGEAGRERIEVARQAVCGPDHLDAGPLLIGLRAAVCRG